jgi:protein-disulfide isomerase
VFGDIEDVTIDPAAEVMQKVSLTGAPSRGPADAKVTMVVYSDFQCPYCARAYQTITKRVLTDYSDKVRVVHKQFPMAFNKWAEMGAVAALCVHQQSNDAYWKVYDHLYANQREISLANLKGQVLGATQNASIDADRFNKCFDEGATLSQVKADAAEGIQVGVGSMPAFLINGRQLKGLQQFQSIKEIIDDELSRSEKKG